MSCEKLADEIKDSMRHAAEKLVKETFPMKIVELHKMFESAEFSYVRLDEIGVELNIPVPDPVVVSQDGDQTLHAQKKRKLENCQNHVSGTTVYALTNGTVAINPHIMTLTELVKPHIRDLVEHANVVKMWITFNIPRIEDGNNFGVSVQEDTLAEARQVESEAATYMDQITRYYISRGKLISKVVKYPHIEDYRQVVAELDRKEFMSLRLVVAELRNNYCGLHDVIMKNLDKIKKPRNSNTENMF